MGNKCTRPKHTRKQVKEERRERKQSKIIEQNEAILRTVSPEFKEQWLNREDTFTHDRPNISQCVIEVRKSGFYL